MQYPPPVRKKERNEETTIKTEAKKLKQTLWRFNLQNLTEKNQTRTHSVKYYIKFYSLQLLMLNSLLTFAKQTATPEVVQT